MVIHTLKEDEKYAEHDRISRAIKALLDYALPKTYCCLSKPGLWSDVLTHALPHPDLVIVPSQHRGEPNPYKAVVIVEIMSNETAELDTTLKFLVYTRLSCLRAYVLVSTSRKLIVLHHRLTGRAQWITAVLKEYDEVILFEVGVFALVRTFYEDFDAGKPPALIEKVANRRPRKSVRS